MSSDWCFCMILNKIKFSPQIWKKVSNIKLHENPSVGVELFHAEGRADRHDKAESSYSQICEHA